MADLGIWFKLWVSALDDVDLDNLDISDFGRWAKLGAFVKAQGTDGTLTIRPPARGLCSKLQVPDFDGLMSLFHRLPHCELMLDKSPVSGETIATFRFSNWRKYQGDFSTHRVIKHRETKRLRGEEKRGDKNKPPVVPLSGNGRKPEPVWPGFLRFWAMYPKRLAKDDALKAWISKSCEPEVDEILAGLQRVLPELQREMLREKGKFVPYPATWLNKGRWKDETVTKGPVAKWHDRNIPEEPPKW